MRALRLVAGLRRASTEASVSPARALDALRNIGILAHIDAGKTTTTERMLYYSGVIRMPGDVDAGNTVTDFLEEERKRGITINSSSISFVWRGHHINLIDTPGHFDFTMEVERSLRVLDGAVVILDAVAGVQAQTQMVWSQSEKHGVSKIVYVNKLDRQGSSVEKCVGSSGSDGPRQLEDIHIKLNCVPLPLQFPIIEEDQSVHRILDLVTKKILEYKTEMGDEYVSRDPQKQEESDLLTHHRDRLLETLSDYDDSVAERFLNDKPVDSTLLYKTIRGLVIRPHSAVAPVFYGSSLKNRGVQPLLDGVLRYLPSPLDREPITDTEKKVSRAPGKGHPLCALVFDVKNNPYKGIISFFRVYSGTIKAGDIVYNSTRRKKERVMKLLKIYADDLREVDSVGEGDIGAAIGWSTFTGDTILSQEKSRFTLEGVNTLPPVFSVTVEPSSEKERKPLDQCLELLQREDPSLTVKYDENENQILLYGMGELHMEIVKHRMINDFHLDPFFGAMRISYREHILKESTGVNKKLPQLTEDIHLPVRLSPIEGSRNVIDISAGSLKLRSDQTEGLQQGLELGLNRGAILSCPVIGVRVSVDGLHASFPSDVAPEKLRIAAMTAVAQAIERSQCEIMEPCMSLEARVDIKQVGDVLSDLTSHILPSETPIDRPSLREEHRRGTVHSVTNVNFPNSVKCTIQAEVPLKEMVGYANVLRSLTAGEGLFSMEFTCYSPVPPQVSQSIVDSRTL